MFLNPAEPVWPGLFKATLVLMLVVGSGLPLSWSVFGARPRPVWIGYAPIMGVGLHLLAANLASWLTPGAVGSWLGFAAGIGLSAITVYWHRRRLGVPDRPEVSWAGAAVGVAVLAGLLYVALANRTHVLFTDEEWHLPLTARMAAGDFPPHSPFSPSFGAAYHYGADLLAASLLHVTGIAPWTAFYLLTPVAAVIFALTAAAAAWDFGASRAVALGTGLVAAFADPGFVVGLPTLFGDFSTADGPGGLLSGFGVPSDEPLFQRMGPAPLNHPHFALGMTLLVVMAASLHAGRGRWPLATFGVALALLPLAETAAFLIGAGATVLYVAVAAWRWSWGERRAFALAAGAGLALACLGGGAVTDALFRNPGGAATQVGFYPDGSVISPGVLSPDGGLNVQIGLLTLAVGLSAAAVVFRSGGLGFLAASTVAGLAARQLLGFEVTGVDSRLVNIPYVLVTLGVIAGLGTLAGRARSSAGRQVAAGAIVALVVAPLAAPRIVSGLEIATQGIYLGYPTAQDEFVRYANQTRFAELLRNEWRALAWMRRELPEDARVLAADAPLVSFATGRAAPQSGERLALFNPLPTPLHLDALTFLARVDLEELDATHVYVTPDVFARMSSEARQALDDAEQFRLLASEPSASGEPLRVYAIQPGAGGASPSAAGYRQLAAIGRTAASAGVGGFLSFPQRQRLLLTFAPDQAVIGPYTYVPRTNVLARYETRVPDRRPELLILHETHVPTPVGLAIDDAIWHGHGLRAYSTVDGVWSQTWRPHAEPQTPPNDSSVELGGADAGCELRVLGEPGARVLIGDRELRLTGSPQTTGTDARPCGTLELAWTGSDVPPFIQVRPGRAERATAAPSTAGLAFDGGVSGGIGVFHVWYRNSEGHPIPGGTEVRLYAAGPDGLIEASSPTQSVARWLGLIELAKERFTDRFEFNARSLRLNGKAPIEQTGTVVDGNYVLTLNIAEEFDDNRGLQIRQVIPVMQVTIVDGRPSYVPMSGIVGVD